MSPDPAESRARRRAPPRLRTVLMALGLIVVLLPLAGIVLLRLYESELIRRTEAELVGQGALVAAAYREALVSLPVGADGRPLWDELERYGRPVRAPDTFDEELHPVRPSLDLAADSVRDPAPDAEPPEQPPDRFAAEAGRAVTPMLQRAQRITLAGIRVVDYRGRVVGTTRGEWGLSLAHREEVARALQGETVSLMRERVSDEPSPPPWSIRRGTDVRVFVALPLIERGRLLGAVVLSRTPMSLTQALYFNRLQLVGLGVVVLALLVTVTLLTSRLIARPVRALIGQARRAGEGDRAAMAPLERPGTLEVAELSEAIASLTRTLADRADYIHTFARSVSHEFKTPLTSMRGAVELMRDHFDEMSTAERERFLGILEADAARLDRLVGRLHELARADVLQPGQQQSEPVPIIESLMERWTEAGDEVALHRDASLDGRPVRVAMAREAFETVVSNLVDNAHQHGGGTVRVDLVAALGETQAHERAFLLTVRDNGRGISGANRDRIFDAFFTTARESGGSGLGLPIARALLRAHGGDIRLLPGEGSGHSGAVFCVELPVMRA